MVKQRLAILILLICFLLPKSSVLAGTVLSSYKYAWGSNVGYINFENVIVDNNSLSGYAWSENSGWIKFNPTQGGVLNDGNGHLSGSAWGESLGWINFSGVTISTSTGIFHGSATGDLVGTVNFDCPNYCDVRTDWASTPATPPTITPAAIINSSSGGLYTTVMSLFGRPVHIDSYNAPLVISSNESGTLTKKLSFGIASVDVPAGSLNDKTAFVINENPVNYTNNFLVSPSDTLVNDSFYDVVAVDKDGVAVHNFSKPITIILPISKNQIGLKNLRLYWLNEKNWKWVIIPDAVFVNNSVIFRVNHLTRFAVFADKKVLSGDVINKDKQNIALPQDKKDSYIRSTSSKTTAVNKKDFANKEISIKDSFLMLLALILIAILAIAFRKRIGEVDDK